MTEVVFVCPDRHIVYDGRTPGEVGVGGGITARIRMATALARLGQAVTMVVNCPKEEVYEGVRLIPLDSGRSLSSDVCIVNSSGGAYSLSDPVLETISSRMKIYWMSGIDPPAGFDAAAFTYVYAKSNFLRQRAIDSWGVDPGQVFVAYNGFENRYFLDAESTGLPRDSHRLVYFSHPSKGLDAAVRVLRILREKDERFHLRVFGGSALWGQEEQGGTSEDGVEFRGLVGQRELARELVQASYSLCLQEREEPFGMVLTESQRAGCVVLASPVGAFPELIDDGLDGFLIDPPGCSELAVEQAAAKILKLAADPALKQAVSETARAVPWSSDLMARVWLQHWSDLKVGKTAAKGSKTCPACGNMMGEYPDGDHCSDCGWFIPSGVSGGQDHKETRAGKKVSASKEPAGEEASQDDRGPHIIIAGYYGFGNTGDEVILSGMLSDLRERIPSAVFTVLSGEPEATVQLHNIDAIQWKDLKSINQNVRSADLVIIGGGGILFDAYHNRYLPERSFSQEYYGLSYFATIFFLANFYKVPSMLYAVGVGPLEGDISRALVHSMVEYCSVITVRDQWSKDYILSSFGLADSLKNKIIVASDPAFSYLSPSDHVIENTKHENSNNKKKLAVCLRHWDFYQLQIDWEREVAAALDKLAIEDDYFILFIPFQANEGGINENDFLVCSRVQNLMTEKLNSHLDHNPTSITDNILLVHKCDAVLGMRYHSVLLGLKAGMPVVGLGYDPKVRSIMTEFEQQDLLLEQPWTRDVITAAVRRAAGAGANVRGQTVEKLKQRSKISADLAVELLNKPLPRPASAETFIYDLLLQRNQSFLSAQKELERIPHLERDRDKLEDLLNQKAAELTDKQAHLSRISEDNRILSAELEQSKEDLQIEVSRLVSLQEKLDDQNDQLHDLRADRDRIDLVRERLAAELREIHHSRYWRVLSLYWRARERLTRLWHRIRNIPAGTGIARLPGRIRTYIKQRKAEKVLRADGPVLCGGFEQEVRKQPDVIILPIIDWEFRFQRPQQLARQAAAHGQRVFYARTALSPAGLHVSDVEENVYRVQLPGPGDLNLYHDAMKDEDVKQILAGFEQLAFEMGITEAVCMIQLPFWTPLALKLRERFGWLLVYDCMDDHGGFSTNSEIMTAREEQLLRECDLALATSRVLYERSETLAPRTLLLPNAVDFVHFAEPDAVQPGDRLDDMPDSEGPVIGYVGAISDWFDFDLLGPAVEAHPDWTFVFIGSTWGADGHRKLARRPNVHFLGEKPYEEVPAYLHQFDCCVIPFKENRLTRATNPVKLYEYLAAGKPVVARKLPELEPYDGDIYLAEDGAGFLQSLELALSQDSPERAAGRVNLVQDETWEARFGQLSAEIEDLFSSISVVIITWNNLDLTRLCLDSLLRTTSHPDLEIIVVDNASDDGTQDALREYAGGDSRFRLILNESNRGFGPALNQGMEAARGDLLAVLNNDVILTPGWLSVLAARLRADPSIGMIGPVSNGAWNEAYCEPAYTQIDELTKFSLRLANTCSGNQYSIPMLALYCAVMHKQVLDKIGFLDPMFGVGMFEDDDFSLRVRQAGWKVVCAADVYIHHHMKASFKLWGEREYNQLFVSNRNKFEQKWGISWEPHHREKSENHFQVQLQIDQIISETGERKGVVIIPPTIGWSNALFQRPHQMAKSFASRGFLTFFCEEATGSLEFSQVDRYLFRAKVPAVLFDHVYRPIVLALPYNRSYVLGLRAPVIVYEIIDTLKIFLQDQEELELSQQKFLESADLVTCVSSTLQQEVREAREDSLLVPNGVVYDLFAAEQTESPPRELLPLKENSNPIVIYYGILASNIFDYELFRHVISENQDLNFAVIGPDYDMSFRKSGLKNRNNVVWLGEVEHNRLPKFLHHADVGIIPFTLNEITLPADPIKIYEYLASGIPIVATDLPAFEEIPTIWRVKSHVDFSRSLSVAAAQRWDPQRIEAARAYARQNTWDARVDVILKALQTG